MKRYVAGALAAFVFSAAAAAQVSVEGTDVVPEVLDPILALERELEERRRTEERNQFHPPVLPEAGPQGLENVPQADPAQCLQIEAVEVDGVTLLKEGAVSALSADLVPGCLGQPQIALLMQRINKAYADKGFITTRTYIPEQDVGVTRTLKLTVLEGFIEGIDLVEPTKDGGIKPIKGVRRRLLLGTAYPHKTLRAFQLKDLEQAVDQISRPASSRATLRLEPGTEAGGSRVVIQRETRDRIRGFAEVNNTGAVSTGQRQARLNFAVDNILRANDTWSFTYQGGNNSNALSVSTSAPYGKNTVSAFASYSDFFIPLTELSELFGRTLSYGVGWNRLVSRSPTKRRTLAVNINGRQSARFVNGVELTPQDLATIDVRFSTVIDTEKARWSWDIGPVAGLPVFNDPEITPETGPDIPQNDFAAVRGGVTRIGKGRSGLVRWTTSLRFQAATRALFSSEQIAFGARSVTRGFEQTTFSADQGAYARIEGEVRLPGAPNGPVGKFYNAYRNNVRAFGFTDIGGGYAFAGSQAEWVGAIGAGLRGGFGRFNFTASVEKSLSDDNQFNLFDGGVLVRASLSAKLL